MVKRHFGTLEIANSCNFQCLHCYNKIEREKSDFGFLAFEKIEDIIDQLSSMEILGLAISGGEPTLHPKFSKIWKLIYNNGIYPSLITNASNINPKIIDLFKRYLPGSISISLYGFSQKSYKSFSKSNQFNNVLENINQLTTSIKTNFLFKFILTKQTAKDLGKAYDFSKTIKDAVFDVNCFIEPSLTVNNRNQTTDYYLPPVEAVDMLWSIDEIKSRYLSDFYNNKHNERKSIKLFGCHDSRGGLYINANGQISCCDRAISQYSFQHGKEKISYGLENTIDNIISSLEKKFSIPEECTTCRAKLFCKSCFFNAKPDKNTYSYDPYLHNLALELYRRCEMEKYD